jgi:predicted transcriptional regulator
MTKLLNDALDALQRLPADRQDYIARAILALANEGEPEEIDPRDLPALLEGLEQIERGEFASDEEVHAIFRRLRE